MKKLSIMLAMILTVTSFSVSASTTECGRVSNCKISEQISIDATEYFKSGKMSELLAYKVSELKESAGDMTDMEAVEILAEFAEHTVELY